jgi:hypothetical protein
LVVPLGGAELEHINEYGLYLYLQDPPPDSAPAPPPEIDLYVDDIWLE